MNLDALKDYKKSSDTKSSNKSFVGSSKDFDEPIVFRASPVINDALGGIPFMTVRRYWFGNRSIVDPITMNGCKGESVIDKLIKETIAKARQDRDDELVDKLTDSEKVKYSDEFWIAGWVLELLDEPDDSGREYSIVDGVPKILQAKQSVKNELINVYTGPLSSKIKSADKFADRKKGLNLQISKSGVKKMTRYHVTPDVTCELLEEDFNNMIDLYEAVRLSIPSVKYIKAFFKAFCEGEEIPDAIKDIEKPRTELLKKCLSGIVNGAAEAEEEETPTPKAKKRVQEEEEEEAPAPKKAKKIQLDEEEEEEAPAPKTKARPKPQLDDDGDVIPAPKAKKVAKIDLDEEEEETPAPKSKATTGGLKKPIKNVLLDDDDEPAKPVKKAAKKLDLDDDDDDVWGKKSDDDDE